MFSHPLILVPGTGMSCVGTYCYVAKIQNPQDLGHRNCFINCFLLLGTFVTVHFFLQAVETKPPLADFLSASFIVVKTRKI